MTTQHGQTAIGLDFRSRPCLQLLIGLVLVACKSSPRDDVPAPSLSSAPHATAPTSAGDAIPELPPGTHEQTVHRADGTVIRYTVFVPEGYSKTTPAPLIVLLHYGGDVTPFYGRGMIDGLAKPAFQALQAILVAPDSLDGDWTTEQNSAAVVWLTRAVMKSYAVDPRKVALSGYSMGGIGTWFIGAKNQDLFTAAIPVASEPAGTAKWKIPLYVIHSRADDVLPIAPVRDHVDKLEAAGARIEWRELDGLTHYNTSAFTSALREAASWLEQIWSSSR